ncbi:MAG: hypothetical protein FWF45_03340 [Coriobacteriia bacterium]|nr:hypothetical protein [Coriobacteriia bacterium]
MLSAILASLAIFISVASFIVSTLMYRSEIKNENYADSNQWFMEFDRIMIEYPMARPYMYDKKELEPGLSQEERDRITGIAELMLDTAEWIADRKHGLTQEDELAQRKFIVDSLCNSPVALEHISNNPDWHPHIAQIARDGKLLE